MNFTHYLPEQLITNDPSTMTQNPLDCELTQEVLSKGLITVGNIGDFRPESNVKIIPDEAEVQANAQAQIAQLNPIIKKRSSGYNSPPQTNTPISLSHAGYTVEQGYSLSRVVSQARVNENTHNNDNSLSTLERIPQLKQNPSGHFLPAKLISNAAQIKPLSELKSMMEGMSTESQPQSRGAASFGQALENRFTIAEIYSEESQNQEFLNPTSQELTADETKSLTYQKKIQHLQSKLRLNTSNQSPILSPSAGNQLKFGDFLNQQLDDQRQQNSKLHINVDNQEPTQDSTQQPILWTLVKQNDISPKLLNVPQKLQATAHGQSQEYLQKNSMAKLHSQINQAYYNKHKDTIRDRYRALKERSPYPLASRRVTIDIVNGHSNQQLQKILKKSSIGAAELTSTPKLTRALNSPPVSYQPFLNLPTPSNDQASYLALSKLRKKSVADAQPDALTPAKLKLKIARPRPSQPRPDIKSSNFGNLDILNPSHASPQFVHEARRSPRLKYDLERFLLNASRELLSGAEGGEDGGKGGIFGIKNGAKSKARRTIISKRQTNSSSENGGDDEVIKEEVLLPQLTQLGNKDAILEQKRADDVESELRKSYEELRKRDQSFETSNINEHTNSEGLRTAFNQNSPDQLQLIQKLTTSDEPNLVDKAVMIAENAKFTQINMENEEFEQDRIYQMHMRTHRNSRQKSLTLLNSNTNQMIKNIKQVHDQINQMAQQQLTPTSDRAEFKNLISKISPTNSTYNHNMPKQTQAENTHDVSISGNKIDIFPKKSTLQDNIKVKDEGKQSKESLIQDKSHIRRAAYTRICSPKRTNHNRIGSKLASQRKQQQDWLAVTHQLSENEAGTSKRQNIVENSDLNCTLRREDNNPLDNPSLQQWNNTKQELSKEVEVGDTKQPETLDVSVGAYSQFHETGKTLRFVSTADQFAKKPILLTQQNQNNNIHQKMNLSKREVFHKKGKEPEQSPADKVYMNPAMFEIQSTNTKTFSNDGDKRHKRPMQGHELDGINVNLMLIHDPSSNTRGPSKISVPVRSPDFQFSNNPESKQAFDYYLRNKRGLSPDGFKPSESKSKTANFSAPIEKEALKQRYRLQKQKNLNGKKPQFNNKMINNVLTQREKKIMRSSHYNLKRQFQNFSQYAETVCNPGNRVQHSDVASILKQNRNLSLMANLEASQDKPGPANQNIDSAQNQNVILERDSLFKKPAMLSLSKVITGADQYPSGYTGYQNEEQFIQMQLQSQLINGDHLNVPDARVSDKYRSSKNKSPSNSEFNNPSQLRKQKEYLDQQLGNISPSTYLRPIKNNKSPSLSSLDSKRQQRNENSQKQSGESVTQQVMISPDMENMRDQNNNNISMLSKRSTKPLVKAQLENQESQYVRMQVERITEMKIQEINDKKSTMSAERKKGSRLNNKSRLLGLETGPTTRPNSNLKIQSPLEMQSSKAGIVSSNRERTFRNNEVKIINRGMLDQSGNNSNGQSIVIIQDSNKIQSSSNGESFTRFQPFSNIKIPLQAGNDLSVQASALHIINLDKNFEKGNSKGKLKGPVNMYKSSRDPQQVLQYPKQKNGKEKLHKNKKSSIDYFQQQPDCDSMPAVSVPSFVIQGQSQMAPYQIASVLKNSANKTVAPTQSHFKTIDNRPRKLDISGRAEIGIQAITD